MYVSTSAPRLLRGTRTRRQLCGSEYRWAVFLLVGCTHCAPPGSGWPGANLSCGGRQRSIGINRTSPAGCAGSLAVQPCGVALRGSRRRHFYACAPLRGDTGQIRFRLINSVQDLSAVLLLNAGMRRTSCGLSMNKLACLTVFLFLAAGNAPASDHDEPATQLPHHGPPGTRTGVLRSSAHFVHRSHAPSLPHCVLLYGRARAAFRRN